MPSPFPGMDPWLEGRDLWPSFHFRFIADMQVNLAPLLRPKYFATVEQRVYIADEWDAYDQTRVPDVRISPRGRGNGRTATVAVAAISPFVELAVGEETIERRLEIRDAENRAVVAVIELVSPSNKRPGSRACTSFVEKRREVLDSAAHWVEIDLTRGGASLFNRVGLPSCEYTARVINAARPSHAKVWPMRLREPLANIAIPLHAADMPLSLNLQQVMEAAYDNGMFEPAIEYHADPVPKLEKADAAWAAKLLKKAGLR